MSEEMRLFAGDCTPTFEGAREQTQRGHVVVLVKPDGTVLVHDADGYQPVAWLTRADAVTVEADESGFAVTARTDDQTLRIVSNTATGRASYPTTSAGIPVGGCPDCGGALIQTGGDVRCLDCEATYSLPAGAAVLAGCDDYPACDMAFTIPAGVVVDDCDCGLPVFETARGRRCLDGTCERFRAEE
ncbi:endonuclease NucS domain-containing protein [Haloprofundus salilacus]|uniref:endonuclease NucS domain-containing protein n=1 Tax=Haloprofundus salilacus TaxID=2876190 RepID=UPI001CCC20F5|nr:endonuclease NucS domain-containing protein [Haloprofundus salilacus]